MSILLSLIILVISLVVILAGAGLFTNGIEWLGKKLKLSEGTVGSILAAVGTALPESMIPVIAIISGHGEAASHVGIGAILGAPFMLGTLAFFVVGISALLFKKRAQGSSLTVDSAVFERDIRFFLIVYALAISMSFVNLQWVRYIVAILLVVLYTVYVYQTVKSGKTLDESELDPLIFAKKADDPRTAIVITQVLIALIGIVLGARLFVNALTDVAMVFNVSPLLLSLIIAPVATELPEKFNSIFWVRDGKDTLAMGNITGAMVFQSSMIPALGIAFTPWELSPSALLSVILALISVSIVYVYVKKRAQLKAKVLIFSGSFYLLFLACVIMGLVFNWPL